VATGSDDATAALWDVVSGRMLVGLEGHLDAVTHAEFSPDAAQVLTTSLDGTARVWDPEANSAVVLQGHESWVWRGHFDKSGQRVVTASIDGTARVWDAVTGAELHRLNGAPGSVEDAVFHPSGAWVATAHVNGEVRIW